MDITAKGRGRERRREQEVRGGKSGEQASRSVYPYGIGTAMMRSSGKGMNGGVGERAPRGKFRVGSHPRRMRREEQISRGREVVVNMLR